MKVLLLGAGASKAYDASPTGVRMPVAADFMTTYAKLDIAESPWVLVGDIVNYVRDTRGVPPEQFVHTSFDIEALHSEIEAALLATPKEDFPNRFTRWRAYTQLVYLFACVVNRIQSGPASDCHRALAMRLAPEDVVITFNWDTLLDRALHDSTSWRVDSGYGVTPHRVFRNEWLTPTKSRSSIRVLKLHGSSNWVTSAALRAPESDVVELIQSAPPDRLNIFESATDPFPTFAGRYMAGYGPFAFGYYPPNIMDDQGKPLKDGHVLIGARMKHRFMPEGSAPDHGLPTMPLIIPPVRQKQYGLFGTLFEDIWTQAQDALAKADTIVVIGYSFPATDVRSIDLFTKAFMSRATIPKVIVVDPQPEQVVVTLTHKLGIPGTHLTVYQDYFGANFDLNKLFGTSAAAS